MLLPLTADDRELSLANDIAAADDRETPAYLEWLEQCHANRSPEHLAELARIDAHFERWERLERFKAAARRNADLHAAGLLEVPLTPEPPEYVSTSR